MMPAAMELRRFGTETDRVRALMDALSGNLLKETPEPWLVFWGPGDPQRAAVMRAHVANGGRAIALDLAYWKRATHFRVSIDAAHPQAWVMRQDWPATRFEDGPPPVESRWNPKGPVIVAGIGSKAHVQYGNATIFAWERAQIAACRERWDRPVFYRRKLPTGPALAEVPPAPYTYPIERALQGASLVITWHSNVAVDAIRMGIPVVCRDGAAAAVCPSEVSTDLQPLDDGVRRRFLCNLAWFQWASWEHRAMWAWLRELLA